MQLLTYFFFQTISVHHRRVLVDRNVLNDIRPEFLHQQAAQAQQQIRNPWIRRFLGMPNLNYQSSTVIVQRLTIPVNAA
jgi:hypothetical protein